MNLKVISHRTIIFIVVLLFPFIFTKCKKFVNVDAPITGTTGASVFTLDATAIAALTNVYGMLGQGYPVTGNKGISMWAGLSADELTLYNGASPTSSNFFYYTNKLFSNSTGGEGTQFWAIYSDIFICNSAIEGLNSSKSLTNSVKQQLLGEADFLRALIYFYLVNFYGDVPMPLGSDYKVNEVFPRTPKSQVYTQIIADLKNAQTLLSTNFVDATDTGATVERVRPTKWAATSLLARVYLYMQHWDSAESQATSVINNSAMFSLDTLNAVFLKNSTEAIWQLQPVNQGWNTEEARLFILPSSGPDGVFPVYLSNDLLNSFEAGDQRRINWVDSIDVGGATYHYSYKYKSANYGDPVTEYLTVIRLAELYLIRAEARAEQNNISGAQSDLNMIRGRAGLAMTSASDRGSLLTSILNERRVELFTEWGHRWFDLKRTGNVDIVMTSACPRKDSSVWQSYQQLYPIPFSDIAKDLNLTQNPGY